MGKEKWLYLRIVNSRTTGHIVVSALQKFSGIFYQKKDERNKIGSPQDGITEVTFNSSANISVDNSSNMNSNNPDKNVFVFGACGSGIPKISDKGTQGSFNIMDDTGKHLCSVSWNCPISGQNTFQVNVVDPSFRYNIPIIPMDGALKDITLTVL